MRGTCALLILLLIAIDSSTFVNAEDWPQFRGHNSSGVSTSKNLPVEFSHKDNVLWSMSIGDGLSSPIVVAGKIYTTLMTPAKKLMVQSHDASTGKEIWQKEFA